MLPLPPGGRLAAPVLASTALSAAYWFLLRGKASLLAMIALPLFFGSGVVGSSGMAWRRSLETYKGELREQGLPMSFSELERSAPTGPIADEAAVAALTAHDTGVNKASHPGQLPGPWTEAVYRAETGFVQAAEGPLLADVGAVLKGHPVRYARIDWAEAARRPFGVRSPRFGNLIGAGNALGLSAAWHAHRGETALAWDRIRTMLDLADLVSSEPSVLGKAVAQALRRRAAKDSATVLFAAKTGLLPADVAERFSAYSAPRWLTAGIQGELAHNLDASAYLSGLKWSEFRALGGFDSLYLGACLPDEDSSCGRGDLGLKRPVEYALFRFAGMSGLWDLNALEHARALSALAAPLTPSQLPARLDRSSDVRSKWSPWPHGLAQITTPNFKRLEESSFQSVGWDRLALTLSALKGFRAARGRLPKTLEELVPTYVAPDAIQDPLTGKAFKYALAGDRNFELCGTEVDSGKKGRDCLKSAF